MKAPLCVYILLHLLLDSHAEYHVDLKYGISALCRCQTLLVGLLLYQVCGLSKGEVLGLCAQSWHTVIAYSKTSLNRPTRKPTLSGPFREVVVLGS